VISNDLNKSPFSYCKRVSIALYSRVKMIADLTTDIAGALKADSAMTLSKAGAGCKLRIRQLDGGSCQRLREIGFCEDLEISKLSDGRNMICSVCGTRLALSKKLGDQVLVEMV
jgi:Fe2+ transport system protein FeoA